MTRRTLLQILLGTFALAACGRRGDIVPPDGQAEDPRLEDFRKRKEGVGDRDGGG